MSEAHQNAVGHSGNGILLVNYQRHPIQPGGETARTGHKATHADDAMWADGANDRKGLAKSAHQPERRHQQSQATLAPQPRDLDQRQWYVGFADQSLFHTTTRTQPENLMPLVLQLSRRCQGRENIATGATSHHQKATFISHKPHLPWPLVYGSFRWPVFRGPASPSPPVPAHQCRQR